MLVNPKKANILWQLHLPRYPFMEKDDFFLFANEKRWFFLPKIKKNTIMRALITKKKEKLFIIMIVLQKRERKEH